MRHTLQLYQDETADAKSSSLLCPDEYSLDDRYVGVVERLPMISFDGECSGRFVRARHKPQRSD
jgi:hypothetical protein